MSPVTQDRAKATTWGTYSLMVPLVTEILREADGPFGGVLEGADGMAYVTATRDQSGETPTVLGFLNIEAIRERYPKSHPDHGKPFYPSRDHSINRVKKLLDKAKRYKTVRAARVRIGCKQWLGLW